MDPGDPTTLVDAFEDVLVSTLALARILPSDQADRPTACPGWTVRDQLSHMVGVEQALSGSPVTPIELPPLAHVVTEFDEFMERIVQARRLLPLDAIADELAGLIPRRVASLRDVMGSDEDPLVPGPFGPRPLSEAMPIRVFDLWTHEQDIRRAVGRPARCDCDAGSISVGRTLLAWQAVLPRAEGVAGELTVQVTGSDAERRIVLGDGGPTASIRGDIGQLTALGCGRQTLADTDATVDGDADFLVALAPHLAFTP